MSVVQEEYKNLTDGSGADPSAMRPRLVDERELGERKEKERAAEVQWLFSHPLSRRARVGKKWS